MTLIVTPGEDGTLPVRCQENLISSLECSISTISTHDLFCCNTYGNISIEAYGLLYELQLMSISHPIKIIKTMIFTIIDARKFQLLREIMFQDSTIHSSTRNFYPI